MTNHINNLGYSGSPSRNKIGTYGISLALAPLKIALTLWRRHYGVLFLLLNHLGGNVLLFQQARWTP